MFEIMNMGLHFTKPTNAFKNPEINKSYECFIVDQSSSYIILVHYNKHAFNLQNAFKGCINACTFYDNLLFLKCSVDVLNQILEYLLIYMFYPFICLYVYFRLRSYA